MNRLDAWTVIPGSFVSVVLAGVLVFALYSLLTGGPE